MNGLQGPDSDEQVSRRSTDALSDVDDVELDIPSLAELLSPSVAQKSVDLNAPSSSSYLAHLSSLPLASLLAEPSLISNESTTVEAELTNLCYREYGTFISIHECSSAVTAAFDDFSTSLDSLLAAVPDLEAECRAFADSTLAIQKERRRASVVQEHQDKLLDVLEIPRLMETCVRNGYYAEALELETHARDLMERYGEIPLIADVVQQVERVRQLMLAQLLALLREPVKLPTLVKAVNFLRRMDMHDSLPIAFLISRQHNLRAQLVSIEKDRTDPTRYVRRYVDLFREHVYDIISQYTAIFLDTAEPSTLDTRHLTTFAHTQLEALLALLDSMIPQINDPASLSSILIQLGYCSLSFARVGLDFADLVIAPFERAVEKTYTDACADAATRFATVFRNAIRSGATPSELLMLQDHMPELDALESVQTDLSQPPPLAPYPPLATFLNSHLTALNALRLLAPLSLHQTLRQVQATSLTSSAKTLLSYIQLATSDQPSLPPVSLSRSNSQTKHSRNPSASLRRRATGQGLSQTLAQSKVSVAAIKAFKVAARYLMRVLDAGVYEGTGEVDERVWSEIDEWLRNAEPPKPLAVEEISQRLKPLVDEPTEMVKAELPMPLVNGHQENGHGQTGPAAEDKELVEEGLVLASGPSPAASVVPTKGVHDEAKDDSGSPPPVAVDPVPAERPVAAVDIPQGALLDTESRDVPALQAERTEDPFAPAAGAEELLVEATPALRETVPEVLDVEERGLETAPAPESSMPPAQEPTTPGIEATIPESELQETRMGPIAADPVEQPSSSSVTLSPEAEVAATLTVANSTSKLDMDSLFEAPSAAAEPSSADTSLGVSAAAVEPAALEAASSVEAEPVEAPAAEPSSVITPPLEETERPMEQVSAPDVSSSAGQTAFSSADVQQDDAATVPDALAQALPPSAEPAITPATNSPPDPAAAPAAAPAAEPVSEPRLEPELEPVATEVDSVPALVGVEVEKPSATTAGSAEVVEPASVPFTTIETQTPSVPPSEPASTNASRAPSPDDSGPVKTSGGSGGKKKNKKKGKKK